MELTDQQRLARIRAEVERWTALEPRAAEWDNAFLLRVIDRLIGGQEMNEPVKLKSCADCGTAFEDKHDLFKKCVHCRERDLAWREKEMSRAETDE